MATAGSFNAEFSLTWKIKKFSFCLPWTWVRSPTFTVESMDNTKWCLQLWPKEYTNGIHMEYYLAREEEDSGPEFIRVAFELSFLDPSGIQLLKKSREASFTRNKFKGFSEFVEQAAVYSHRRHEYLPEDTLTACCRMKIIGGRPLKPVFCFATSEIAVEQNSFDWNIENFSKLRPGVKRTVRKKYPFIKVEFSLTDKPKGALQFEISHAHMDEPNMTDCEIAVMSSSSDTLYIKRDCRYLEGKVWEFPIFVMKSQLTAEKNIYLRKDVLTLKCYISVSLGVISSVIDGYISRPSSHKGEVPSYIEERLSTKHETISSAKKDIGDFKNHVPKLFNGGGKSKKEILEKFSHKDAFLANESSSIQGEGYSSSMIERSSTTQNEESSSPEDEIVGELCEFKDKSSSMEEIVSTSSMKKELHCFYQDETFSDIELTTGDESFPAHRLILSLKSRTFKEIFMKDLSKRSIKLPDLDTGTLQDLLDFIYTDKVSNMTWEKAEKLFLAAKNYQVTSLKQTCLRFMKESIDDFKACSVLILADEQQDGELKEIALEFIVRNGKAIMNTKTWDELAKKNIKLAFETMQQMYLNQA